MAKTETGDWIDEYVNDMERGERLVDVEESMQQLEKILLTVGPSGVAVQFAKPMWLRERWAVSITVTGILARIPNNAYYKFPDVADDLASMILNVRKLRGFKTPRFVRPDASDMP